MGNTTTSCGVASDCYFNIIMSAVQHSPKNMHTPNKAETSSTSQNKSKQTSIAPFFALQNNDQRTPLTKRPRSDVEDPPNHSDPETPVSPNDNVMTMMATLMKQMQKNHAEVKEEFIEVKSGICERLDKMESSVSAIDSTVNKAVSDIVTLQRKMDEIEQDKLASHMEITGVDTKEVDANKADIKSFVRRLFVSFDIVCDPESIVDTFVQNLREDKRRIVVVFTTSIVKSNIMKKKRESSNPKKIFFDHRMTSITRDLYLKSRRAAKVKGGRVFLYGGRVYYSVNENSKKRIFSPDEVGTSTEPVA